MDNICDKHDAWGWKLIVFGLISAFSFLVVLPMFLSYTWPDTHDGWRYVYLQDQFKESFLKGYLYPRWLPNLYGGYGYPEFVFYQPGFFFMLLPISACFASFKTIFTIYFIIIFVIGGFGVYKLVNENCFDKLVALFSSIFFLITPYFYADMYVRGDYSELSACLLSPWVLYFLTRIKKRIDNRKDVIYNALKCAFMLALIEYTHPFVAAFVYVLLIYLSVVFSIQLKNLSEGFSFLTVVAGVLFLGVALSCPHWLTVLQLKEHVYYSNAIKNIFDTKYHTVHISQFFSFRWNFGGSEPGLSPNDMSFQLGFPHFLLCVLSIMFSWRKKLYLSIFVFYIFLILAVSDYSFWLWENISLLRFLQFPWRLFCLIAIIQAILIGGIANIFESFKSLNLYSKIAILSLYLIISLVLYLPMFDSKPSDVSDIDSHVKSFKEDCLHNFVVLEIACEWIPKYVKERIPLTRWAKENSMFECEEKSCTIKKDTGSDSYFFSSIIDTEQHCELIVNQLYFPGWNVSINGKKIDEKLFVILKDGRFKIPIQPGKYVVSAEYGSPPGAILRHLFFLIGLILGIVLLVFYRRISSQIFQSFAKVILAWSFCWSAFNKQKPKEKNK